MDISHNLFDQIISLDNLLQSWLEFRRGKRHRFDVQVFERHLEDNLFVLHQRLKTGTYQHGNYSEFTIHDPKFRRIHKATVADRIVHHAVYRILYPIFDRKFIFDSYSCRDDKGTHRAVMRLEQLVRRVSRNYHLPVFALKCDIRQFFGSINHQRLKGLISWGIPDTKTYELLCGIIDSFVVEQCRERERE